MSQAIFARPDSPITHPSMLRNKTIAVKLINADKKKYLHHIIADLPSDLPRLVPEDFRLSRLKYVEPRPYPEEEFERTRAWMLGWGLVPQAASFEDLVDNRISAAS